MITLKLAFLMHEPVLSAFLCPLCRSCDELKKSPGPQPRPHGISIHNKTVYLTVTERKTAGVS